ncbi:MAG: nicotinate (nicotinamide) nucleotide adenylyltransferase [Gemmatimonadota bacterium]|nr:MAG: nicotinate (nicotinamide) nucleotide adenylyltransferase [Gemmatimonadota bacterium]
MRLGVFGGSFDPPHVGHLIVADDAAAALGLDRVCFIPAGTHPLKRARVEAPGELRLRMIEAATAGRELFEIDDREIRRPGPSYSAQTLAELQAENPGAELFILVGADILGELHRWHRVTELAERGRITVMSRADAPAVEADVAVDLLRIDVTHVAISSSEVRERIKSGRPYRYLVPEPVYRIIEQHSLYRSQA